MRARPRFVSFSGASGGKLHLLLLRIKIDGEEFVASNKAARGIRARYFQISGD